MAMITTIIPTYQRPERLKKAIQSVLDQTYSHFELRVYDNASCDATAEVVAAFTEKDPRVHYYCHPQNIGAPENFQYGLSQVNTPFFSFLSDDDFLLPEFYATAIEGFKKYPETAYSAGAVIDMSDQGTVIQVASWGWQDQEYFPPPEGLFEMIGKYSNWTGALFRTELVKKIGPLDLSVKAIDVDYLFRIAARFPIVISKKPCAVFVQHASSYSGSKGVKMYWPGWFQIIANLKKDEHLSNEVKEQAEKKILRDLENALLMNAVRHIEKQNFDEALFAAKLFNQQCSHKIKKFLLNAILKLSQKSRLLHLAFVSTFKLRRSWNHRKHYSQRKHQYTELAKILEKLS
jgi:glycosyltransferase involved in cell wall biosynthesis